LFYRSVWKEVFGDHMIKKNLYCYYCSNVLAGEIAKLKIKQEKLELEELEANELSYL